MVFLDTGRTEVRNWLAGDSATYPSKMLFGTESSTPTRETTSMSVSLGKDFEDTITSVERQIQWEGILLTTELTTSTIAQIGIASETGGTGGMYIIENINPIEKNDTFDIQVLQIMEVD